MLVGKDVLILEMVTAYKRDCQGTIKMDAEGVFQSLLNMLNHAEIRMLREHEDLIERVREIANYKTSALLQALQEDFDMKVTYAMGVSYLDADEVLKRVPDWADNDHCGWDFDPIGGQYNYWARGFLMQEVQVNLWIRFFEEQKKRSQKEAKKVDLLSTGQYI